MTGTDWVAATAGDPLQPLLLMALRTSVTPETDEIVNIEADQLGALVDVLSDDDQARLAFLATVLLSLASLENQTLAMNIALNMKLPVVWRRTPYTTPRGAFGERR
jgi:hypothetical protein